MLTELIAVVDEHDTFIENQPRHIVHRLGLRHRSVHILILNNKKQVFLQKRALTKDINPGLWDTSAAGHVNAGESYLDAAIRETEEELGISVKGLLKLRITLPAQLRTGMEFIAVYYCQHNGPFNLEYSEIDTGAWFAIDTLSERIANNDKTITDTFKLLWVTTGFNLM